MAKELLAERPELSLADIAAKCGYHDYNYFINVFTQAVGTSPGVFRRKGVPIHLQKEEDGQ